MAHSDDDPQSLAKPQLHLKVLNDDYTKHTVALVPSLSNHPVSEGSKSTAVNQCKHTGAPLRARKNK